MSTDETPTSELANHLDEFEFGRSQRESTKHLEKFLRLHSRADATVSRDDWAARLWAAADRLEALQAQVDRARALLTWNLIGHDELERALDGDKR